MITIKEPTEPTERQYDLSCVRCKAVMRCTLSELTFEPNFKETGDNHYGMKCPHCKFTSFRSVKDTFRHEYVEPQI